MPKGTPRTRTETVDALPLVSSKRGKYLTLEQCDLDAQVHADLFEYVEFVRDVDGEEPKVGGIVSAALERLFEADNGFPKWRENKRSRARAEAHGANGATGQEKAKRAAEV